jgi:hypothetical protein
MYRRSGRAKKITIATRAKQAIATTAPALPNPRSDRASAIMFRFSLNIVAHFCAGPIREWTQSASQVHRLVNIRERRRTIFLQVHVRKSAIIQMHSQTRVGKPVMAEQGTDRCEDNLMLRFEERIAVKNFHEFVALLARARLVAERPEDLGFCRATVHGEFIVQRVFS